MARTGQGILPVIRLVRGARESMPCAPLRESHSHLPPGASRSGRWFVYREGCCQLSAAEKEITGARIDGDSAVAAECSFFEINPLDRMGRCHGAAVFLAVSQIEGVSYFVDRFLDRALELNFRVAGQSVELLPQSMRGEHRTRAAHLSLTEDVSEDWNVEIYGSDSQYPARLVRSEALHVAKDFR